MRTYQEKEMNGGKERLFVMIQSKKNMYDFGLYQLFANMLGFSTTCTNNLVLEQLRNFSQHLMLAAEGYQLLRMGMK